METLRKKIEKLRDHHRAIGDVDNPDNMASSFDKIASARFAKQLNEALEDTGQSTVPAEHEEIFLYG